MRLGFYLRAAAREARGAGGRLAFFVACLGVGVAGVAAVAGLSDGIAQALRGEARKLLAADLSVEGHRPIPHAVEEAAAAMPGARTAVVKELATMASGAGTGGAPGPSRLVELKAVAEGYPFYGDLVLSPARPLASLLAPDAAVVAPELLGHLGTRVGGTLRLGEAEFRVAGTVEAEPDRAGFSLTLAPRVFVSLEGLRRAGLEAFGSRISHRLLVALPAGAGAAGTRAAAERLRAALADPAYHIHTYADAQPSLRRALDRGTRFLGLVALLSLVLGGIGVAQTVRSWVADRMDAIAVLRCFGLRPREVLALYAGQTALLALVGSAAGAALGAAVTFAGASLVRGLLPVGSLPLWQPLAALRGLALGVGVALAFSLPALASAQRVPPLRVIRRDAEPLAAGFWVRLATLSAVGAATFGAACAQSGSPWLGAQFAAGLGAAALALWGASALAIRASRRLPEALVRGRAWLRHGLGALGRPGSGVAGTAAGLGLGVLLVVTVHVVQAELRRQFGADLPRNAPTAFLLDVQPDQWEGVRDLLVSGGAEAVDSVPVVMARLRAVDGRSVEELSGSGGDRNRRRWQLTREQRLTYLDRLPPGNEIVEGRLWSGPGRPEVSVEAEYADGLGARLGSRLTFDVQGVPLELTVTSLRTVEWRTFGINFFLVVAPGVLERAPQFRLASARLPKAAEQRVQDLLATRYPNVTLLRVREILEKVVGVLDRLATGVKFLGGFTVAAGVAILAGAVWAGSARRGREVALLKTLGMTRREVAAALAAEYALTGALAGMVGAAGAAVASWGVLTRGLEAQWRFDPAPYAVALAGSVALAAAAGLAASLGALRRRPVEVLREE